ncbi:YraN family protein [Cohnella lubricantis]|uniref:UPF0102 protein H4Q31_06660 n=2 Tax=Cohnella lubricantis TaxID=2163172 RepID=A0A841T7W9_9BACL|nr:YraN family protein [Cohnella lubricantis]
MDDSKKSIRPAGRPADRRRATGREAEEAAARHLAACGYRIIDRNWRCRAGEIDLIASDSGALVFVEVRSRRNPSRFGTAVEAVTPRKQAQVRNVAQYYLAMKKIDGRPIRFDVIAVTFDGNGEISELRHLEGAF